VLCADYKYTGDGALLLKHLDKIEGIAWLLRQRRTAALAAYPESDSRHGMPTGILPLQTVPLLVLLWIPTLFIKRNVGESRQR
jgi:hypothetical protein